MTSQRKKRAIKNTTGFTLIEVIITLSIMVILSALIYPNMTKLQQEAKNLHVKNIGHTVQLSLETYYLSTHSYPNGENLTLSDIIQHINENQTSPISTPQNPYTRQIYSTTDPSGQITYTYNDDTSHYEIKLYGHKNTRLLGTLTND